MKIWLSLLNLMLKNKDAEQMKRLYKTQISLTEWLENIGHEKVSVIRDQDNVKRDRMEQLSEIIDFPYDRPTSFRALDVANGSPAFLGFLEKRGGELCALRLIPQQSGLPKLRMRGHTIRDVVSGWFKEQDIDHTKYQADFVPHPLDNLWSTIFVVNCKGISGEIVAGSHHLLTQGFYDSDKPITFYYDFFNDWRLSFDNSEALIQLKEIVQFLYVPDQPVRQRLKEYLGATFYNNYLCGYFETVTSSDYGIWFIDYNQSLGQLYDDFRPVMSIDGELTGQVCSQGWARGVVRIIDDPSNTEFNEGEILVCDMTSPDYVPLMKRAVAIITDRGGILSHAAIVSRELGKPCIMGTGNATRVLKDGDLVEVDADKGIIKKVTKSL